MMSKANRGCCGVVSGRVLLLSLCELEHLHHTCTCMHTHTTCTHTHTDTHSHITHSQHAHTQHAHTLTHNTQHAHTHLSHAGKMKLEGIGRLRGHRWEAAGSGWNIGWQSSISTYAGWITSFRRDQAERTSYSPLPFLLRASVRYQTELWPMAV